jgi:large subunit ribosomal protein L31
MLMGMILNQVAFRQTRLIWHTDLLAAGSRALGSPEHTIRPRPNLKEHTLKKDLHPKYVETTVTCTCGSTFQTRSTVDGGRISSDVCSQCHPFYTGKQKILDTGGRIARFQARYGKKAEKVDN